MPTPAAPDSAARRTVLLLNGPNLNLLGERDPAQYGTTTLADIERRVRGLGAELGAAVRCEQSNHEGVLVDLVHEARGYDGIVLNPGAFAHYSIALRDAIDAVDTPCVEVHISNVYAREEFRHTSVTAPVAAGYVAGCGVFGYELALRAVLHRAAEAEARR
ncbi:type II 3-dehydroquinate dehydratase [Marinitenerispora sediminis]|uniref:3-dehydroquinate dehydratase n=1 Tax=Marinitenerispora sediminis TaxID=1931232 RepID=A0A368T6Q5_9ACTN|nr:type II 3-dehydroquinate dehydratase [Marinitenerispora sediminis]RCV52554.1 type II 3-dehydroquinate dehydratase [Marinitenerispora sediminis]RCV59504.1 type II 3-dehydroquinate dehydratase [Marinitenerispora sediminis]RCV59620.1 type II 3-dehydroquinate dehydratase [Marinitenerispora sediminis]